MKAIQRLAVRMCLMMVIAADVKLLILKQSVIRRHFNFGVLLDEQGINYVFFIPKNFQMVSCFGHQDYCDIREILIAETAVTAGINSM